MEVEAIMKQTASKKKKTLPRAGKKTRAIGKKDEIQDLCTTCNYAMDCVNATDEKRPVYYCEEYDDYTPPIEETAPETKAVEAVAATGTAKYTGICVNCEHRETCPHSMTEGGIWHCEEYA
jgi:hypothetical protein